MILHSGRAGRWPRVLRVPGLIVSLVSCLATACGGDADPGSEERVEVDGTHGQVVLDGTVYEVSVRGCNLSGTDDGDGGNTLDGLVVGPDEKRYTLEVSRIALPTGISHSVWISARGRGWSAERVRAEGRWADPKSGTGGPDEPLVRITGNDVAVDGTFRTHGGREIAGSRLPGSLRATCPR